jgi:hypothetical protein
MNVIAYGSLLNQNSLEKTLGRKATLIPITLLGFQRVFNAQFGDYAFLNVEKMSDATIETAYFSLDEKEAVLFAEREKGSELIEVMPGFVAFVWPEKYCRELPVLQSYIDVCLLGAIVLEIDFWRGTKRPQTILDDRKSPLYP